MQTRCTIPVAGDWNLTEFRPGDVAALVAHLNDPEIYARTLRLPFPYAAADAERFLGIAEKATARHGHPVHWALRQRDGRVVGGLGCDGLVVGHRAEIGYWLARPLWGQGLMTRVVGAACAFAEATWNLVRIEAQAFSFNLASARVLEKNGFLREGLLRKHLCKNGRFIDAAIYARVR